MLLPLSAVVFLLAPGMAQQKKLTPEQVVQNHLASLGSAEARGNARTRVCEGTGRLEILKGGFGKMSGPAGYVAEDVRQALEIQFGNADYSREALSFTGTEVQAVPVLPGQRSRLGDFLYTYPQLMREGLFGGVYATGWPLLDLARRNPRLHYAGIKKIEGKKAHQLDYEIADGRSDLKIKLFFDEKTFRHIRTQYSLTIRYGMRSDPSQSVSALDAYTRYELVEAFSEFRQTDGLDLPFRWDIRLTTENDAGLEPGLAANATDQPRSPADARLGAVGGRSFAWEWKLKFDRIHHNQQLNPGLFDVMK
ncbi:MAG: hypothetical protein ACRD5G_13715 [Candidatus Acidiferrales bacterium]